MPTTATTCPRCGAPLPEAAVLASASQPFVPCAYCGTTSDVVGGRVDAAATVTTSPLHRFGDPSFLREVEAAFEDARRAGASAHDALVATARAKLPGLHGEAFARVCLALATEFDTANGTATADDGKCMGRLVHAYLLAIEHLRTEDDYDVNLSFFAVSPEGVPVHLQRTLTAEVIAELAQRSVVVADERATRAPEPVSVEEVASPAPKKKWYWPFGD